MISDIFDLNLMQQMLMNIEHASFGIKLFTNANIRQGYPERISGQVANLLTVEN
jgi:hypothetical protein